MSNNAAQSHKETTAHIRQRIAKAGVKASVSKYNSCGTSWIRVAVSKHELNFTPLEQTAIKIIAKSNGLTKSRGLEIDINSSTNPQQFDFVVP
jgi:hypothetical protein